MAPTVPVAFADESNSDSRIIQSKTDESTVAAIGDTQYDSLQKAFDDVPTNGTETTVTLESNIEMTTGDISTIKAGQNVVLELNGKNITVDSDFAGRPIVNEGALTVIGEGSIDSSKSKGGYGAINNHGTLHIKGGSFVGNVDANGSSIRNTGSGSVLVIDGGSFSGSTSIIYNEGRATLNGGTYAGQSCSSCNSSAWAYTVINSDSGDGSLPEMTINGGTYSGVQGCISASIGTLIVNNGEFSVAPCDKGSHDPFYALYVAGEDGSVNAIINGGTFQRTGNEPRAVVQVANDNKNGDGGINAEASMIINGGTFTNNKAEHDSIHVENLGSLAVYGGEFIGTVSSKSKTGFIYGGTFQTAPYIDYIANGYVRNDSTGAVSASDPVAYVGETGYASVADAISASQGDTVVLTSNVTESITIPENAEVTLDLNGCTITNAGNNDEGDHAITNNGKLTIVDSSKDGTGTVDCVTHGKGALVNYGTVTVKGGTFTRSEEASMSATDNGGNSWYVVDNQGTMTFDGGKVVNDSKFSSLVRNLNGKLTINAGEFKNDFIALKNDEGGTLVVKGGTVTSEEQSLQNWSNATLSGGTFNGRVATWGYTGTDVDGDNTAIGETTITGSAVVNGDVQAINYKKSTTLPVVTVSGGTVNGDISKAEHEGNGTREVEPDAKTSTIVVTGGSFEKTKSNGEALPYFMDKDVVAKSEDGSYVAMERNDLEAGDYIVPDRAEGISAEDLAPGLEVVENADGTFTVVLPQTPPPAKPSYDVAIAPTENGSVAVDPKGAKEGEKVTVTVKPDEGFELVSLVVADEDGNALKLELSADGTYSFEMPAGDVTVHAAFECDGGELCPSHGFTDVDQSQWYHAAIDWAVEAKVLNGIGGTTLMMPDGEITRAQMAQVLWNVEGRPAATEDEPFSDVSDADWFADAVAWVSQEGIFQGYDGAFDPDAELTREQAAAVLMRWAASNGEDVSGRADLSGFPDADGVSEWAVESVQWAVDAGVLQGVANPDGTTTVSAQGTATRAQVAALMMRLEGQRTA